MWPSQSGPQANIIAHPWPRAPRSLNPPWWQPLYRLI